MNGKMAVRRLSVFGLILAGSLIVLSSWFGHFGVAANAQQRCAWVRSGDRPGYEAEVCRLADGQLGRTGAYRPIAGYVPRATPQRDYRYTRPPPRFERPVRPSQTPSPMPTRENPAALKAALPRLSAEGGIPIIDYIGIPGGMDAAEKMALSGEVYVYEGNSLEEFTRVYRALVGLRSRIPVKAVLVDDLTAYGPKLFYLAGGKKNFFSPNPASNFEEVLWNLRDSVRNPPALAKPEVDPLIAFFGALDAEITQAARETARQNRAKGITVAQCRASQWVRYCPVQAGDDSGLNTYCPAPCSRSSSSGDYCDMTTGDSYDSLESFYLSVCGIDD